MESPTNDPDFEVVESAVVDAGLIEAASANPELDDIRSTLIQLQADFDNYRKRSLRDADERAKAATGDLVAKLLPVLDVFDLAVAHYATEQGGSDVAGTLVATRKALLETLESEGLVRIDVEGAEFDPEIHDAVTHEPGEESTNRVSNILRAGYLWKGSTLRAALVAVRG